jgi:hypothetical protein
VPHQDDVEVVETLAAPVVDVARHADGPVLVTELPSVAGPWYSRALVLQLERRGLDVRIDRVMRFWFTATLEYWGGPVGTRVMVANGDDVGRLLGADGFTLLARWRPIPASLDVLAEWVVDGAEASHDAGDLSGAECFDVAKVVGEARAGDRPATTAFDVAVFLDERPPGTPLPPEEPGN